MEFIKKYLNYIIIAILVVIILFLIKGNTTTKETTKVDIKDVSVKIPEIIGTLKPSNITELPSKSTDSIIYKDKIIYTTHPIDKKLADKYLKANDSLKQILYIQSIQQKENVTDFSDKNIDLKVWTKVQGELKDIRADYKVKEREVIVQEKTITNTIVKRDNFNFLAGGGYNHSLSPNVNSSFEVNVGVRVGKINIIGGATTERQVGGKVLIES